MADESAPFSCFASLCQVIHQSDQRFLVISYTNDEEDVLRESLPPIDGMELRDEGEGCVYFEVGEIGATTAWWRGIWTLEDVQKAGELFPSRASRKDVIKKINERFKEGYLSIGGHPGYKGDSPTQSRTQTHTPSQASRENEPKPFLRIDSEEGVALRICLDPLPPPIAVHRAAEVLFAISSHLSSTCSSQLFSSSATYSYAGDAINLGSPNSRKSASPTRLSASAREEILKTKRREAELEKQVKYLADELKKHEKEEVLPPPVIAPGRSLGNPSKKARKVQKVEFDDADEDEDSPSKKKKRRRE